MNLAHYQNHLDNVRLSQERAARGGQMDDIEYRAALKAMRLSQVRAARWLGISGRTSQAYALGERPIPHVVVHPEASETRLVRVPVGIPPAPVASAAAIAPQADRVDKVAIGGDAHDPAAFVHASRITALALYFLVIGFSLNSVVRHHYPLSYAE